MRKEGEENMSKKGRLMKFIGIMCWFLALFMLMDGRKEREAQEAEEAKQAAIEMQMEANTEGNGEESTLIFPSE